jgi:hypothetical protein
MIGPEAIAAGARLIAEVRLPHAEEAWEPVLFGALIPAFGVGAVLWLIYYAVKDPPEHNKDLPEDDFTPPPGLTDDDHEGPLS